MYYLKQARRPIKARDTTTAATVAGILTDIERDGEAAVRRLNRDFDGWHGDLLVDTEQLHKAGSRLPESVRADLFNFNGTRLAFMAQSRLGQHHPEEKNK